MVRGRHRGAHAGNLGLVSGGRPRPDRLVWTGVGRGRPHVLSLAHGASGLLRLAAADGAAGGAVTLGARAALLCAGCLRGLPHP